MFNELKKQIKIWRSQMIDVGRTMPTAKNLEAFFTKTKWLYNKSDYVGAFVGLEKLSKYEDVFKICYLPQMELCKKIKSKSMVGENRTHDTIIETLNIKMFKHFVGLQILFGLAICISGCLLVEGWDDNATSFLKEIFINAKPLFCLALFVASMFIVHQRVNSFSSALYARCKHCGSYFYPELDFGNKYQCEGHRREHAAPDFNSDGWDYLIAIEDDTSNADEERCKELQNLKAKFIHEYFAWKKKVDANYIPPNNNHGEKLESLLNRFLEEYGVWEKKKATDETRK